VGAERDLNGELDIAYSSPEEFAEIVLAWFGEGVKFLAEDISEEILAGPPLKRTFPKGVISEEDPAFSYRPPPLWGEIFVMYPPRNKVYSKPYSHTSLERLALLAPELRHASISLHRITDGSMSRHSLQVDREGEEQGHARLIVQITADADGDYTARRPEIVFMRRFAGRHVPAFGHISYVSDSPAGQTELEDRLRRRVRDSLHAWDRYLRGYSWVTVVPAVLAGRVGGAAGLPEAGAFVTVEELPAGGVWLEAASRWSEYRGERVERVFEALAPLLPPGMPRRPVPPPGPMAPEHAAFYAREYLVSWRDAADFGKAD
jgi:hypothetical protein